MERAPFYSAVESGDAQDGLRMSQYLRSPSTLQGFRRSDRLHLLCQYPSGPHRLDERHGYDLDQPKEWWVNVSPWLRYIIAFLKQGVPLAGAVIDAVDFKNFEAEIDLLEKVTEDLSNIVESDPRSFEHTRAHDGQEEAMIGPALPRLI